MEIACEYSRESYNPPYTSLVSALLLIERLNKSLYNEITIQSYGFITIDSRWAKLPSKLSNYYIQSDKYKIDKHNEIFHNNRLSYSSVISKYSTNILKLPIESVVEGVIVQFELSTELLSSYKGLSSSISYGIHIRLSNSNNDVNHSAYFPFNVNSHGLLFKDSKYLNSPYIAKTSEIRYFKLSDVLHDSNNYLSNSISTDYVDIFESEYTNKTYSITLPDVISNEAICTINIFGRYTNHNNITSLMLLPNEMIQLHFNFNIDNNKCAGIKCALIQTELRYDDSCVQERTIHSVSKDCRYTSELVFDIFVPNNTSCSFKNRTITVSYHILVDFYISKQEISDTNKFSEDSNSYIDPFNFILPVIIVGNSINDKLSSYDEALLCIESLNLNSNY